MASAVLIDTDVLVDVARNVSSAAAILEQHKATARLSISTITEMELLVGCRSKTEQRDLNRFLSRFQVAPLTPSVSSTAIRLLRSYRLSHGQLMADALIAATLIDLDLPLLSGNQRDFRFITGLGLLPYR